MKLEQHSFWILVTRSREVADQWVAHCLKLDIVTQGNSIEHAFEMAREAVSMCVRDDVGSGLDPLDRSEAPDDCWAPFWEIMKRPVPLNSVPPEKMHHVQCVAGQMHVVWSAAAIEEPALEPQAWQLAGLRSSTIPEREATGC